MKLFVAIDDTDNRESIGTGKLARMLADELERQGLAEASSVTRHQLLVHPDIPYTSHNSCACIAGETASADIHAIADYAVDFLLRNFHAGADPGLCVATEGMLCGELVKFGLRAQQEVIQPDEARELAARLPVFTWWRGEPWRGCIGAMAGVALRSTGNDGRFIGLHGIRDIKGTVTVRDLLQRTGVDMVSSVSGTTLADDAVIDSGDWIRPSLRNHQAVLFVQPAEEAV
jgi:tRNA(Ile2) C34 agmatinyltransferase TiaS